MCTQLQYETISTSLGYNFLFPKLKRVEFWRNILWLHTFMHTFPLKGFYSMDLLWNNLFIICVMALPCIAHSTQQMVKIKNLMKFPKYELLSS